MGWGRKQSLPPEMRVKFIQEYEFVEVLKMLLDLANGLCSHRSSRSLVPICQLMTYLQRLFHADSEKLMGLDNTFLKELLKFWTEREPQEVPHFHADTWEDNPQGWPFLWGNSGLTQEVSTFD